MEELDMSPKIEIPESTKPQKKVVACPYRSQTTYQADDGRRIETYTYVDSVETEYDEKTKVEFMGQETLFLGVAMVQTPEGPQEIKFAIPDAKTVQEAFSMFHDQTQKVMKMMNDRIRQNNIVMASSQDLDRIKQSSSIIQP